MKPQHKWEAQWSGHYPCYCHGEWKLLCDGKPVNLDAAGCPFIENNAGTYGEYSAWSKAKIEIRKFSIDKDGVTEIPNKGISLSNKQAVDDLTNGLVEKEFGDTRNILKSISKREDFKETVETINNDPDDSSDGELFDMRSLLLNIDNEVSEEE